jgi:hypothetical protein
MRLLTRLCLGALAGLGTVALITPSTGLAGQVPLHVRALGATVAESRVTTVAPSSAVTQGWVRRTRLVNYYPADNGWSQMWTNWQPATIDHDMAVAHSLGANTIRIITFPYTMGWPTVTATMENRVETILRLAKRNDLQVQLTLFDFWGQYGQLGKAREWTRSLLQPIASSPQLRFVEVQNEVDLTHWGIVPWIESEINAIHRDAPGVPVTVSSLGGLGGMTSLMKVLTGPKPDFWDLHYYGGPQLAYPTFVQAKRTAGRVPLMIGEAGYPTDINADAVSNLVQADRAQYDWFEVVDAASLASGLGSVAPWTLYDFSPTGIPYPNTPPVQYNFGLYTAAGVEKPVGVVVHQSFAGQLTPHVLNPAFTPLTDGSGQPADWNPWFASGTMGVVAGAGPNGANVLGFSGTAQQVGGASSYYQIPMQPLVHGQTWKASVWARGVAATGTTEIQLAWYTKDGHWLGSTRSSNMTLGTSSWQLLQVTGSVPSAADAVRIYLQSSDNTGSTYFYSPSWSVS